MPQHFGKYILLEKVGSGGMAELFMAKQTGLKGFEKMMAIKRILPHLTEDPEFVTMFINEAKLAALLTHENIVQIFDLGHIENSYYIAMEYVMGKDLRTIQTRAKALNDPISVEHALLMISKVCAGLDYAHRKKDLSGRDLNLVHRDISPQNILVSYDASVKVVDFGIAKAASQSSETATGILKGKLAYMAPEQAWGKPIDCRADIFAIGIVLYETLTGKKLFKGDNDFNTLERVRQAKVEPLPSELNQQVTPELEAILLKALAKEPEDRYQSAADLQADIEDHMSQKGYSFSTVRLTKYFQRIFQHDMEEDSRRFHSGNGSVKESATATMEFRDGPGSGPISRPGRTPTQPSRKMRTSSLPGRRSRLKKKKVASAFLTTMLTMGIFLASSIGLARHNPPFLKDLTRDYPPVKVAVNRLAVWPDNAREYGIHFKDILLESVTGQPRPPRQAEPPAETVALLEPPQSGLSIDDFGAAEEITSTIDSATTEIVEETPGAPDKAKRNFTLREKKEIRSLLADAKTAYNEGRLDDVEQMLNRLIELNPTIPVTYHLLGMVRKEKKDPEGAIIIFGEASRQFPDSAILHYDLGFLYFQKGVSSLALDELGKGLDLDPNSPMAERARKVLTQLGVTPPAAPAPPEPVFSEPLSTQAVPAQALPTETLSTGTVPNEAASSPPNETE